MRVIMFPYKMGSQSLKALANYMYCKRVYSDGNYTYKRRDIILNWGNSTRPQWDKWNTVYINTPECVALSVNKLTMLRAFDQSTIPSCPWTTDIEVAKSWITQCNRVYCRTLLQGSGGDGIIIATTTEELVLAPLYTKGVKNETEYRVHVFDGRVIDYAKKGRKRLTSEEDRPSSLVRNYTKGWVFIREGVELPQVVKEAAIASVRSLGLVFGAVDVCTIKGSSETEVCVFEVNSAPGFTINSTTCREYAKAIYNYVVRH